MLQMNNLDACSAFAGTALIQPVAIVHEECMHLMNIETYHCTGFLSIFRISNISLLV